MNAITLRQALAAAALTAASVAAMAQAPAAATPVPTQAPVAPAATAVAPAPAATVASRLEARHARQDRRIAKGVESGALTPKETAHLENREAHNEQMEGKALADGKVTKAEAHRIHVAERKESHRIWRQKHDAQRQPS